MASLGVQYGFHWKTLWDLADNAALKDKRKNPGVLFQGDVVTIPDKQLREETRPTEAKHRFVRKAVPEKLRLRFLDLSHQPRANLDYIIVIDGDARRGKTNSNGELKESIAPGAKEGKLVLGKDQSETITLNLGHLAPVSEMSGVKSRLANLGFYNGPIDANLDDATQKALSAFQTKQGLPVTGKADDTTTEKLLNLHGH
jgi:hypothetical protein